MRRSVRKSNKRPLASGGPALDLRGLRVGIDAALFDALEFERIREAVTVSAGSSV